MGLRGGVQLCFGFASDVFAKLHLYFLITFPLNTQMSVKWKKSMSPMTSFDVETALNPLLLTVMGRATPTPTPHDTRAQILGRS